jgi:hypothetical protein
MQAVSGYLMAKDSYGKGENEFALRTVTGKVRFSPPGAIPPMREGDMITVVVAGNAICAITDLTTGAEFRYQPMPPYRSEKISARSLLLLNVAIGLLPIIGYLHGQEIHRSDRKHHRSMGARLGWHCLVPVAPDHRQ